jgi:Kef-type K+ transport system membrane component KefB
MAGQHFARGRGKVLAFSSEPIRHSEENAGPMLSFLQFIFAIAIIIAAAKLGGYLSQKLGQPTVAGKVLVGLILGPSLLNLLQWPMFTDPHLGESISHLAELGVLLLMFTAGLELHLSDLAESGKVAALAGTLGFGLTLGLGSVLALAFSFAPDEALFFGLLLAPTSIGISAQTLMELSMLRSRVGVSLLSAAAIDDTLAVLGVSMFLAFRLSGSMVGLASGFAVLLRMLLFLVVAFALGLWLVPRLSRIAAKLPVSQGLIAFAFITMLLYAWAAEVLGGMAAIIGAFMAGLFLGRSPLKKRIETGFTPLVYGVFVPIFFISVGLAADIRQLSAGDLGLLVVMCLVVLLSKLLGAGLAGRFGGLPSREALQLGVGMLPRGEVTLIVATVGITEDLIGVEVFSIVVGIVVVTVLLTPLLLRRVFAHAVTIDLPIQESS